LAIATGDRRSALLAPGRAPSWCHRRAPEGAGHPHNKGPTIALIYGTGLMVQGGGTTSLLGTAEMAPARSCAFRDAFRTPRCGRSVPHRQPRRLGGRLRRSGARVRARERGAGHRLDGRCRRSGGYYVAAPADKIVAQPAT
jgi:protease-4